MVRIVSTPDVAFRLFSRENLAGWSKFCGYSPEERRAKKKLKKLRSVSALKPLKTLKFSR